MWHLESDGELESLARLALSFLFVAQGAQVISNERLPGIWNAQILIRVLNLPVRNSPKGR
jgi:hypothetical protein